MVRQGARCGAQRRGPQGVAGSPLPAAPSARHTAGTAQVHGDSPGVLLSPGWGDVCCSKAGWRRIGGGLPPFSPCCG